MWEARAFLAVLGGVVVWSLAVGSIVPLLFIGLPSFYGAWMLWFFATTQHAGLREDVLDHRLNTRTVYMNPVLRFLYLNMNYHLEHHLFPTVPYHALPGLHREVASHLPRPNTSVARRLPRDRRRPAPPAPATPTGRSPAGSSRDGPAASTFVDRRPRGHVADARPAASPISVRSTCSHRASWPGSTSATATFVLCRPDDGYVLLDGMCTHSQTHLAGGLLIDGCIECPKHNGRFDLRTGEPTRRPVKVPLGTYSVSRGRRPARRRPVERPARSDLDGPALAHRPPGRQPDGERRPPVGAGDGRRARRPGRSWQNASHCRT